MSSGAYIETSGSSGSPLFRLPAELRSDIWAYALTEGHDGWHDLSISSRVGLPSALLQTCRQIYFEAKEHFDAGQQDYLNHAKFVISATLAEGIVSLALLQQEKYVAMITDLSLLGGSRDFHYYDGLWVGKPDTIDDDRPGRAVFLPNGVLAPESGALYDCINFFRQFQPDLGVDSILTFGYLYHEPEVTEEQARAATKLEPSLGALSLPELVGAWDWFMEPF